MGILIVLPILTVLMFGLGLSLKIEDFKALAYKPKALILGIFGQLVLLPAIAFLLAELFNLPAIFYLGIILIACCPGGSSSNVFSRLAGGDVALSITLTAISSIVTMFTIPVILSIALGQCSGMEAFSQSEGGIHLPVGNLLIQNILLMFIPIVAGFVLSRLCPVTAGKLDKIIAKISFPALMLLATIFFIQHHKTIGENIATLGAVITLMLVLSAGIAALASRLFRLSASHRKTIVIEVGMQNAAQAIAIASSPFIFNNSALAIPAIIYALMMNVVLLIYVAVVKKKSR
ncbi:MAG: bile acid:sodium symporter family protein [Bacteroidales bacterium]|nr:bile acid:sodium symporter family protein [Bacteroidales bacterium]